MTAGVPRAWVALLAAAALLGGCSGASEPTAQREVHLTLTTYDEDNTPGAALVHHFVDEVKALDPDISITVRFHGSPQEPDAVTAVSNGSADLAMVASRAFDSAGVTTLQALNAPFLIDSNELANVIATSDLVPDLLGGLGGIGVVGLAIAPEGLRHLFGRDTAPVAAGDLRGATVRAPQSQAVWSFLAKAGATPIFDDTRPYDFAESQFDQAPVAKAAGNVTLFAKYDVIGLNAKTASKLSTAQVDTLRRAATRAATWAVGNVASDRVMAKAFCEHGGQIAHASPNQLKQWRALGDAVVDNLRSVHATSELIDAITTMKTRVPATPPAETCTGPAIQKAPSRLNGTYTYSAPAQAFRDVGLHDQSFIDMNAGTYTVTLHDGVMTLEQRYTSGPQAGTTTSANHTYTLDRGTLTIRWSAQAHDWTTAQVTVLPDGSLDFRDWIEGDPQPKFLLQDQVTLKHWSRVTDSG